MYAVIDLHPGEFEVVIVTDDLTEARKQESYSRMVYSYDENRYTAYPGMYNTDTFLNCGLFEKVEC